jgi:hypothetical protein
MADLDVCLLTSISEGLPLIILEAFAAGVPCVATDVGACRELIYGRTPADKALGRAGLLTKICSPLDTADAVLRVIASADNLLTLGQVGRTRAERHYRQTEIIDRYRKFYTDRAWANIPDARAGVVVGVADPGCSAEPPTPAAAAPAPTPTAPLPTGAPGPKGAS